MQINVLENIFNEQKSNAIASPHFKNDIVQQKLAATAQIHTLKIYIYIIESSISTKYVIDKKGYSFF